MRRRTESAFDVREVIKPPLTYESQPEDLDKLLAYFLSDNIERRKRYLKAIGR
jgi:hypothetical protein